MSPEERQHRIKQATHRLVTLRSIAVGLDNAREVFDAIAASENRAAALVALQSLLGIDDFGARAIAELQWGRLTRDTRPWVEQEIQELEGELRGLEY